MEELIRKKVYTLILQHANTFSKEKYPKIEICGIAAQVFRDEALNPGHKWGLLEAAPPYKEIVSIVFWDLVSCRALTPHHGFGPDTFMISNKEILTATINSRI